MLLIGGKKNEKAKQVAKPKRGGVHIGVSDTELIEVGWGKPKYIIRTTTQNGNREQWVYGGRNYLYLENSILTTAQNLSSPRQSRMAK